METIYIILVVGAVVVGGYFLLKKKGQSVGTIFSNLGGSSSSGATTSLGQLTQSSTTVLQGANIQNSSIQSTLNFANQSSPVSGISLPTLPAIPFMKTRFWNRPGAVWTR